MSGNGSGARASLQEREWRQYDGDDEEGDDEDDKEKGPMNRPTDEPLDQRMTATALAYFDCYICYSYSGNSASSFGN